MLFILKVIIFVLLPRLNPSGAQVVVKFGLITSNEFWNLSVVENTISRRVNANWKMMNNLKVTFVKFDYKLNNIIQNFHQVCSQTDLTALITLGNCNEIIQIDRLVNSLQLPHLAIPHTVCDVTYSDYSVQLQMHWKDVMKAAVAVVRTNSARRVVIYFDSYQDMKVLRYLHEQLSASGENSISAQFYQIDKNGSVSSDVKNHMIFQIKKKIFNIIVLTLPKNVLKLLQLGKEALILQQNYFWSVIDTGVKTADLQIFIPSQINRVEGDSNILIIRSGAFGIFDDSCPSTVRDVFPTCNQNEIRSLDVRMADAIEALSIAANSVITQSHWLTARNYSCEPLTAFNNGLEIMRAIKSFSNYDTSRGLFTYNKISNVLETSSIAYTATDTQLNRSPLTQFLLAGDWKSSRGLYKVFKNIYPNKFTGWKNRTLQLCSAEQAPFVMYSTEKYPNGKRRFTGMLVDVLAVLSRNLEFRYEVDEARDKQWGSPLWLGAKYFTGCVGELQNGTMDIGASVYTNTAIRDTVIDFTVPVFEEANAVLVARPKPGSKIWNIFKPFSLRLWICVGASMIVAALFTCLLSKASPLSAWNLKLPFAISDEVQFLEHAWSILGSFLQQGQDFYPYALSSRIALTFWWIFTVIVFGTYTGDLTAYLTVTVENLPIKTLEDLADQTAINPFVPMSTNIDTLLATSTDKTYQKLHSKMVSAASVNDCANKILTNPNLACITDYTVVLYMSRKYCDTVYMVPELFNTAPVSFMTPEDAYFKELLDFYLTKMHESGNIDRWMNKYWTTDKDCFKSGTSEADSIELEGTGGIYIISMGLYGLGFIVLAIEVIWNILSKEARWFKNDS